MDLVGLGELPGGADVEPNIYLVPVGRDYMRAPTEADRTLLAWNDRWIIVIPASAIDANHEKAMNLIESDVKDVKLGIRAYARQGN